MMVSLGGIGGCVHPRLALLTQRFVVIIVDSLLASRDEVAAQLLLKRLLGNEDNAAVNVTPVPFEVRVHTGKWAVHGLGSYQQGRPKRGKTSVLRYLRSSGRHFIFDTMVRQSDN